jgi:hypothetical protein
MSNMKIMFKLGVFLILIISSIQSLSNEEKSLSFDSVYSEELQNSEMKFYSLNIDSNVKDSDLLIETIKIDSTDTLFESPLVLVSLVIIF